jgi:hypothetical protein
MSEDEEANTLEDGDSVEVQGSSSTYELKRTGNVYMCSCVSRRGSRDEAARLAAIARGVDA